MKEFTLPDGSVYESDTPIRRTRESNYRLYWQRKIEAAKARDAAAKARDAAAPPPAAPAPPAKKSWLPRWGAKKTRKQQRTRQ